MENFINAIDSVFYIDYSIVNIIAIYLTIKLIYRLKPKWIECKDIKKIITVVISIIIAILFNVWFGDEAKKLLVSAFLSIVAYDYLIKKLLTFLNIK